MVLVGVQPRLIQVPPTSWRSIIAVAFPAAISASASGLPPCPEPMMMASKFSVVIASALTLQPPPGKTFGCRQAGDGTMPLQVGNHQETATDRHQILEQGEQQIRNPPAQRTA